jgi:hypothetical protein
VASCPGIIWTDGSSRPPRSRSRHFAEDGSVTCAQAKATEATYTALARVAAGNGDPSRAFELVEECKSAGLDAKLRTYSPSLVAFCEAGQLDEAIKVRANAAL